MQNCLEVARDFGDHPRPRCGGHSYGGWSTGDGLVIDVTRMAAVNASNGTVTIGAGARLVDVYAGLAAAGVALPAGSCATVGISGLTLGGGSGVVGRSYGLTCDRLTVGRQLITADGTLRHCTAGSSGLDGDLFWASQGGGGGNFGIATAFTFTTVAAPPLIVVRAQLAVVRRRRRDRRAGSRGRPRAPDEIWSTLLLIAHPGGTGGARAERPDRRRLQRQHADGLQLGERSDQRRRQPAVEPLDLLTQPSYLSAMLYEGAARGLTRRAVPPAHPDGRRSADPQARDRRLGLRRRARCRRPAST